MYLVSTIFMFQASVENCSILSILLLYVLDRQNATSIPFTPYFYWDFLLCLKTSFLSFQNSSYVLETSCNRGHIDINFFHYMLLRVRCHWSGKVSTLLWTHNIFLRKLFLAFLTQKSKCEILSNFQTICRA